MVSITSEANKAIRHVRSKSVDSRAFEFVPSSNGDDDTFRPYVGGGDVGNSHTSYSRFADITMG